MHKIIIILTVFVLALGLGWIGLMAEPQEQQPPRPIEEDEPVPEGQATLRVQVEQIQVDVTVTDRKGNLIQGLTREHFKVYEDKVEQEITNFSPVEAPMTAVFVAEYSKVLPWEALYEVWWASRIFVSNMRPGDWVAMVAYDIRPEILVDFTQNPGEVVNALRRLNYPAFRESNLYDTIIDTLGRLEEVKGKVAVILVTSGLDTFSKHTLQDVLKASRATNVVIYPVSLLGNYRARYDQYFGSTLRLDFQQADVTLRTIAKNTGGEAYFPRFESAFPGVFENISAMLRSQYTLSYVSSNPVKDDKYRKIRVDVEADVDGDSKPDKLKVRHKDGYIPKVS